MELNLGDYPTSSYIFDYCGYCSLVCDIEISKITITSKKRSRERFLFLQSKLLFSVTWEFFININHHIFPIHLYF